LKIKEEGPHCTAASGSLRFSIGPPTRRRLRIFAGFRVALGRGRREHLQIATGLRFSFRVTLRRLDLAGAVYYISEPQKIPLVMRPDETRRLLAIASNFKVRALLSLGYGCGPARRRGA
jgi:hypothetical protein